MNEKIELVDPKELTIDNKSAPSGMSFAEMKKAVDQFKKLQKIIKALPKEEKAKLLPPARKREIPESISGIAKKIFDLVNSKKSEISEIFANSVNSDKPDGNKSISLSSENCEFTIAIIRKTEKAKKPEKKNSTKKKSQKKEETKTDPGKTE